MRTIELAGGSDPQHFQKHERDLTTVLFTGDSNSSYAGVALRAGLLRAPLPLGPAGRTAAHPAHP